MSYYIHVEDAQFAEPPWPGIRRLGPYGSKQEAQTQLEHDQALGLPATGPFTEKDSDAVRGND